MNATNDINNIVDATIEELDQIVTGLGSKGAFVFYLS